MADFDIPADLVDLQRAWYAAGAAAPTPEQEAELTAAREERLQLTEAIHDHDWWSTVDDRLGAKAALPESCTAVGHRQYQDAYFPGMGYLPISTSRCD